MSYDSDTDDPLIYGPYEEVALMGALDSALDELEADEPEEVTQFKVRADVQYAGESRGVRETWLNLRNWDDVKGALDKAKDAAESAGQAKRSSSYRAKSAPAQLRQLGRTRAGREALSNLGVSDRTFRRWQAGGTPGKANAGKLADAYEQVATRRVTEANAAAQNARHQLAETVNEGIYEGEGRHVRLTNIEWLRFQ
jgi:hypothetical protein